ncbi:hypothetical protein [Novosphingobium naphthalenivorans]|uniref:hypothetical protein n=1 Tax=Novosphingobium naphthalenivorans TaxID=273168 RepID=UPI00082D1CF2|nr:hypothetical protein [Novosphingobium naphthalenivorans]
MVFSIALVQAGDEMKKRPYLILAISSAIFLVLGFYIGANYLKWFYFSDDDVLKAAVYHDAIEGLVAAAPGADRSVLRENLQAMHPDFFRSKEYECVRFMPRYGQYSFVRVFCRNIADKSVKIYNY